MTGKKALLIAAALFAGVVWGADDSELRKVSVNVELTNPPEVNYKSHSAFAPKTPSVSKYLMLRIEYTPESEKEVIPSYRLRKGGTGFVVYRGWLDDVDLSVKVMFHTGVLDRKRASVCGLFTGKTRFWTIKKDGLRHLALMFVPAKLLDRYCIPGNRGIAKKNFQVEVTFSRGGKVIGQAYCNVPGSSVSAQKMKFEREVKRVPESLILQDAVIPRSRSPWALLTPDNYDLEKDVNVSKQN